MRFSISTWLAPVACALVATIFLGSAGSVGCGYDDRDYAGVVFACDAQHPCPDNGPCINGKCQPSDGGGGSGQQGVTCGSQLCGLGTSCCVDFISNAARCVSAGCAGSQQDLELQCDGKEDCSGGRSCCLMGVSTACGTNCPGTTVCSSNADCTSGNERFCCDLGAFPVPLKLCQPAPC